MSEQVRVEREAGVGTVILNRPERMNSLTNELMVALAERLGELEHDAGVRCVVLTGAGDRAFSAGADLGGVAARAPRGEAGEPAQPHEPETLEASIARLQRFQRTSLLLHTMAKPTLAAINGAAAGASLSMCAACDLRVMSDSAVLTTAFQRIGFSGDFGGSYLWTRILGTAKARELYLLGERVHADRALELGMVHRVYPQAEFRKQVRELAQRLAEGPPVAYRYMKRNLNLAESGLGLQELLDLEAEAMMRTARTEDFARATAAFLKKEKPEFRGR
ncbi:MAG: enoyl-CoA hydratase-related protein [Myxococcota bacterium]